MDLKIETLTDAGMRTVEKMDKEDMAALKLCLLSTGALLGLGIKGKFLRRLTGLTCTILAAGLAVPLCTKYLDELKASPELAFGGVDFDEPDDGITVIADPAPADSADPAEEAPAEPVTPADFAPEDLS